MSKTINKAGKDMRPVVAIFVETAILFEAQDETSASRPHAHEMLNVLRGKGKAKKDSANEDIFSKEVVDFFKENVKAVVYQSDENGLDNLSTDFSTGFAVVCTSDAQRAAKKAGYQVIDFCKKKSKTAGKKKAPPPELMGCLLEVPTILKSKITRKIPGLKA